MAPKEPIRDLPKPTGGLRSIVKSQTRASLAMFRDAVEQCTDDLWLDDGPPNAFWQIAYHTKLEHQLIAIRHIQHHTAQLMDRLRAAENVGVDWVGAR